MKNAAILPYKASPASALPIGGLVKGKRATKRLTTKQATLRLLGRAPKGGQHDR
jgi:hypothetical protein